MIVSSLCSSIEPLLELSCEFFLRPDLAENLEQSDSCDDLSSFVSGLVWSRSNDIFNFVGEGDS